MEVKPRLTRCFLGEREALPTNDDKERDHTADTSDDYVAVRYGNRIQIECWANQLSAMASDYPRLLTLQTESLFKTIIALLASHRELGSLRRAHCAIEYLNPSRATSEHRSNSLQSILQFTVIHRAIRDSNFADLRSPGR